MIAMPNALMPNEASTRHFGMAENRMADEPRKILLPRRPGEPRFGPPQYYYPASRTGVMPCWGAGGQQPIIGRSDFA